MKDGSRDETLPDGAVEILLGNVTVRYATTLALDRVDLRVPGGEFLGLIGPNGAGKTTLLRVIAGTLPPAEGTVSVGDRRVDHLPPRDRARLVAVVPQVEGPPAGFSVEEVILMGRTPYLRRLGPIGEADRETATAAMRHTRIDHLRGRLVETLSGGERQRVLIARALAQDVRVLLLDEPTAHLDIAVQLEIMDLLAELHRAGLTMVAALHDLNLAGMYCRRLVLMERGRIAGQGSPEEVLTPETLRRVYGAAVLVRPHPATGRPHVTIMGRNAVATVGRKATATAGISRTTVPDAGKRRMIVAIDGPMGSGKSTLARGVARALDFRYINTGWMYRAVAREALRRRVPLDNGAALAEIARTLGFEFRETPQGMRLFAGGEDITDALGAPEVSEAASRVSIHPPVREALVALQRQIGAGGGVVMEGRDIGTVVFPDADVKVFLNATPEERARRRYNELREKGVEVSFEELRAAEEERDRRDRDRPHSPLRVATDAVIVDTTGKSADQVVAEVLALCRERADVV